jgi:hypothetical protein
MLRARSLARFRFIARPAVSITLPLVDRSGHDPGATRTGVTWSLVRRPVLHLRAGYSPMHTALVSVYWWMTSSPIYPEELRPMTLLTRSPSI